MSILPTNHLDQSIEQPDILAVQDQKFVINPNPYTISNPHPEFGKNNNIVNELGHTQYPKMIYPNGKEHAGVVVMSAEDEANFVGNGEVQPAPSQQQKNSWS